MSVDTELETPEFGHRSAWEKFVHACEVHWDMFGGRVLLPAAAGFEILFAWLED